MSLALYILGAAMYYLAAESTFQEPWCELVVQSLLWPLITAVVIIHKVSH